MDKYEKLFNDIEEKTLNGELCWEPVLPDKYEKHLFGFNNVLRLFKSDYYKETGEDFTVLLIEKRRSDLTEIEAMKNMVIEILFLRGEYLVFTLTRDYVDHDKLLQLAEYIQEHTKAALELFSGFSDEDYQVAGL